MAKRVLSEEEQASLDWKLRCLYRAFRRAKDKKDALPKVKVTFYEPCSDPENDAYESMGIYRDITGTVSRMDLETDKTIIIDKEILAVENIIKIN